MRIALTTANANVTVMWFANVRRLNSDTLNRFHPAEASSNQAGWRMQLLSVVELQQTITQYTNKQNA